MDEQRENEHQAEAKTTGQSPVVSQFTDEVRERMSLLRPQAAEGVQSAAEVAHRAAGKLGRQMVSQATSNLIGTVNDNPLLLGALGLTARVLLAASLPGPNRRKLLLPPLLAQCSARQMT